MIIFLAPGLVRPRGIASRRPGCRTPTWWSWGDRHSPSPLAASRSSWWSSSAAAQRAPSSTRCCCAPTRAPPSRPRHPPRRLTSPRAPDDDVTQTGVQSGVWFYFFPLTAAWRSSAWAQSSNIQRNDSTWRRWRAPCCISRFSERRKMVDGVPKRTWAVLWFFFFSFLSQLRTFSVTWWSFWRCTANIYFLETIPHTPPSSARSALEHVCLSSPPFFNSLNLVDNSNNSYECTTI